MSKKRKRRSTYFTNYRDEHWYSTAAQTNAQSHYYAQASSEDIRNIAKDIFGDRYGLKAGKNG
jgi:hypothetical protein